MGRSVMESIGKELRDMVMGESKPKAEPDRSGEPVGGDELNGTFTGGYGMMNRAPKKAAPKEPKKK